MHPLTRNIAAKLADVQDEIATAFADYIPVQDTGKFFIDQYLTLSLTQFRVDQAQRLQCNTTYYLQGEQQDAGRIAAM